MAGLLPKGGPRRLAETVWRSGPQGRLAQQEEMSSGRFIFVPLAPLVLATTSANTDLGVEISQCQHQAVLERRIETGGRHVLRIQEPALPVH